MTRFLLLLALAIPAAAQQEPTFLNKTAREWRQELQSADVKKQRHAAFALGKLGSAASGAVPDLIRKLGDGSPHVREAAAFALGNIARDSAAVREDPALLAALQDALGHPDAMVRRSAVYALGCLGDKAAPALKHLSAALKDADPAVRQNVAWALGKLKSKDVVLPLQKALRDGDPHVRRDAAVSIVELSDDAIRTVQEDLVSACDQIKGVRPEIMAEVRKPALRALARTVGTKDGAIAPRLMPLLPSEDVEVRMAAALILAKIGGPHAKPAVPVLHSILKSKADPASRAQAAATLGDIGKDAADAIPDLIAALSDADPQVRRLAAVGLAGMKDLAAPAVPRLIELVADSGEQTDIRKEAATSLGLIGSVPAAKDGVPKLVKVLDDRGAPVAVRERVIWALRVHNIELTTMPGVLAAFENILAEPRQAKVKMLYYDSAYMLGMLKGPKAPAKTLDVLLDFLKDPTTQVFIDRASLPGRPKEGDPDFRVWETGQGDGRVMAVQALTSIGAAVRERGDIIQQLQVIAADRTLWSKLRDDAKALLKSLGK
jgi:HEAT repeat protein